MPLAILLTFVQYACRFYSAIESQPRCLLMQQNPVLWTGHCLIALGTLLVATSYWALGFYATFLGMIFGYLLQLLLSFFV